MANAFLGKEKRLIKENIKLVQPLDDWWCFDRETLLWWNQCLAHLVQRAPETRHQSKSCGSSCHSDRCESWVSAVPYLTGTAETRKLPWTQIEKTRNNVSSNKWKYFIWKSLKRCDRKSRVRSWKRQNTVLFKVPKKRDEKCSSSSVKPRFRTSWNPNPFFFNHPKSCHSVSHSSTDST